MAQNGIISKYFKPNNLTKHYNGIYPKKKRSAK